MSVDAPRPQAVTAHLCRHWLIVSQVYVPDPAAVGQYLHDVARELVARGHQVTVLTSAQGYQDPKVRYERREQLDGVEVRRLPFSSFGKSTMGARLVGGTLFLGQALVAALKGVRVDGVLVSTSPPLAPPLGALVARLLGAKLLLWMMDINPDQAVVSLGYSPRSRRVRLLDRAVRHALEQAASVVTLDRFMAERLLRKLDRAQAAGSDGAAARPWSSRLSVIPPWPLLDVEEQPDCVDNPFRRAHSLGERRVLMYSGNISETHPLDTLLRAFAACPENAALELVFVGEGTGAAVVDGFIIENPGLHIRRLPYQPLAALSDSLAAADVHLISMGDEQVGIVHPCKVYGVMKVGRPFVYLGPSGSHIGDILAAEKIGFYLGHGDIAGGVRLLSEISRMPAVELSEMGRRAALHVERDFSRQRLLASLCEQFEAALDTL